jgi:hypothetical protein
MILLKLQQYCTRNTQNKLLVAVQMLLQKKLHWFYYLSESQRPFYQFLSTNSNPRNKMKITASLTD